jgi:hypothetical protein
LTMTLAYACWIIAFFAWGLATFKVREPQLLSWWYLGWTAVAGSVLAGWLA